MYIVKKCQYATTEGNRVGYLIESALKKNDQTLFLVNRYLHTRTLKSDQTCRQYAYRLAKFMNFLAGLGKTYLDAEDEDIVHYMHSLQYDLTSGVVDIRQRISPHALAAAYAPVRSLYIYLYDCNVPIKVKIEFHHKYAFESRYLEGIAPNMPKPDIVMDQSWDFGAPSKEYIRWYTDKQKDALLASFRTLRDKAIFSVSLDGFRVDEILSSCRDSYDQKHGLLTPYRSKRRQDGEETRCAPLSERSMKLINDYLFLERAAVEIEVVDSGHKMPDELFVVLRHGTSFGQPLTYRAYYGILKATAKRAGFDPSVIRTHSGRSTRANEIVTDMAKHPGKWTDKEFIDIFGWKSESSSAPYINRNDPERQIATAKKLKDMDDKRRKQNG